MLAKRVEPAIGERGHQLARCVLHVGRQRSKEMPYATPGILSLSAWPVGDNRALEV
jgi:hypothetical protein